MAKRANIIEETDDEAMIARIREKEESRRRDWERLERGEVTAEELQRENSIFPKGWVREVGIPDFFEKVGR